MTQRRHPKKDSQKPQLTRRDLLGMGLGGPAAAVLFQDPINVYLRAMIDGIIADAQAQASGVRASRVFYFSLRQGPDQAIFNLPLIPNRAAIPSFVTNTGCVNCFNDAGEPIYDNVEVLSPSGQSMILPPLWGSTGFRENPSSPGTTLATPLTTLLDSYQQIVGVRLDADGHTNNQPLVYRAPGSNVSICGRVADVNSDSDLLPPVGLDGSVRGYKSTRNVGIIAPSLVGTGALNTLMNAFAGPPANWANRNNPVISSALDSAMAELGLFARSGFPGADVLHASRAKAETRILAGLGDLSAEYTVLEQKYQRLIDASKQPTAPLSGVRSNAPIHLNSRDIANDNTNNIGSNGSITNANPLNQIINANTNIAALARQFAIAEFALKNRHTSVLHGALSLSPFININNNSGNWGMDEHAAGRHVKIFIHLFYWRAIASCIMELREALRTAGIWNDTLIVLSSEFPRSHRGNGGGASDHLWQGQSVSLFGGMIAGPIIQGNIHSSFYNLNQTYHGTIGIGAPVSIGGRERHLNMGDVTTTLADLLGVAPPVRGYTTVVKQGDRFVSALDRRNV